MYEVYIMAITLTQLRTNLYKIVDHAIATGIPVEINRNGVKIKLIPEKKKGKLANLVKHPKAITGDLDDLIHIDWSSKWKGKNDLS